MRKFPLAIVLFAVTLFAAFAMAADSTGNWSGELQVDGDPHPVYLVIKQDGNTLTGSGGPNESEQNPMQNGKVTGNTLTFDVPAGKGNFHFELTMEGDTLKGLMQRKSDEGTQSATVALKRVK